MPDFTPNFAGVIDALRTIIQVGIAGGSGGATQAQVKAAIESAANLPSALVNGGLRVDTQATKDYLSSALISTTALSANAIFTSSSQTNSGFNKIRGWIVTTQSGVLYVEHSRDSINWRGILAGVACNNGVTGFEQPLYSNYYRFVYINGATAQSTFELVATQFGIGA